MDKNVQLLASLYYERRLNRMLFESKYIPQYTYEQADAEISREIDKLEPTCYTCSKV